MYYNLHHGNFLRHTHLQHPYHLPLAHSEMEMGGILAVTRVHSILQSNSLSTKSNYSSRSVFDVPGRSRAERRLQRSGLSESAGPTDQPGRWPRPTGNARPTTTRANAWTKRNVLWSGQHEHSPVDDVGESAVRKFQSTWRPGGTGQSVLNGDENV